MKTGTIIDLFGGVRGTIFAGLAGLFLIVGTVTIGVQQLRIAHKDVYIKTVEGQASNFKAANAANLETIAGLKTRYDTVVRLWTENNAAAAEAAERAAAENEATNRKLAATQHELGEVYARIPSARAWGAGAVDPAVARILRAGAGAGEDQNRRGGKAGTGAAR